MDQYPKFLEGFTTWNRDRDREAEFIEFILRSAEEFSFQFDFERSRYSGRFRKNPSGTFAGDFSARGDGGNRSGNGQCVLKEENGTFLLDGTWIEDGVPYEFWHAELSEI